MHFWIKFNHSISFHLFVYFQIRMDPDADGNTMEEMKTEDVKVKSEMNDENAAAELPVKTEKPELPKIPFKCESCGFVAVCNYKGTAPPFSRNIKFAEECYVMQDPFSPPPGNASSKSNSEYFIVMGADCCNCSKVVCAAGTCSLFYQKTYCCNCAYQTIASFPLEIQSKIRKIISSQR